MTIDSDTPKPRFDEMIGALTDTILAGEKMALSMPLSPLTQMNQNALRAALDTLREHERVVAERDRAERNAHYWATQSREITLERDAARAELAEARAELETAEASIREVLTRLDAAEQTIRGFSKGDVLPAPHPEDAMEAATRIVTDYVNRVGAYDLDDTEFQQYESDLIDAIARVITAAREAEREKCRAVIEAANKLGDAMNNCQECDAEFKALWDALTALDRKNECQN